LSDPTARQPVAPPDDLDHDGRSTLVLSLVMGAMAAPLR
jgi:hypothetical protein